MKMSGSICYDTRWGSVRLLSGRDPISVDLRRLDGIAVLASADNGRAPPLRWIVRGRPLSQRLGCVLAI